MLPTQQRRKPRKLGFRGSLEGRITKYLNGKANAEDVVTGVVPSGRADSAIWTLPNRISNEHELTAATDTAMS